MKKFAKIVSLIAAICAGVGLLLILVGGINGGFVKAQNIDKGYLHVGPGHFYIGNHSNNLSGENVVKNGEQITVSKDGIKDAVISVGATELEIVPAKGDEVVVINDTHEKVEVYVDDGCLKISTPDDAKVHIGGEKRKLTIELPAIVYDNFEIDLGAVDAEIMTDINCTQFVCKIGAGNVDAKCTINAKEADIDVGAGNLSITKLYVDMMDADVGMGNFDMSGDVKGNLNADVGMGNITMTVESAREDHNYDIDVSAGTVTLGKQVVQVIANEFSEHNDSDYDYDIDCSMGSVDVIFVK